MWFLIFAMYYLVIGIIGSILITGDLYFIYKSNKQGINFYKWLTKNNFIKMIYSMPVLWLAYAFYWFVIGIKNALKKVR